MGESTAEAQAKNEAHHYHEDKKWHLQHHFETPHQQFDAGKLGIWVFLVTEVLFFSGLFVAYGIYRMNRPELFAYASGFLDTTMGATNTAVLILSSLTAAWAVRCAQLNQRMGLIINIVITLACAATFMVIKYFEYNHKMHNGLFPGGPETTEGAFAWNPQWAPGHEVSKDLLIADDVNAPPLNQLKSFFGIYFCMTGLHGFHVLVGMGLWVWMLINAIKGRFSAKYFGPIDYVALYWHIVDLIWIFLFPLLYLIGGTE